MATLRPMLPTSASELPRGKDSTYEVKWDGYRVVATKVANGVRLISRNQKCGQLWSGCASHTQPPPHLHAALESAFKVSL